MVEEIRPDGLLVEDALGGMLNETEKQATEEPFGQAPEGVTQEVWDQCIRSSNVRPQDDFLFQLERGRSGKNVGLGNGLKGVNNHIYGTHMGRYYLIGADSGVGKSTISDFMFVHNLWLDAKRKGRRVKIFYCSFEMSKTHKLARWCSWWIAHLFKTNLPSDYILGNIAGMSLTDEHYRMVLVAYSRIREMMADIYFQEDVTHPTNIFNSLITNHYEKEGKVFRTTVSDEDKRKGKQGYVTGYAANDPDLMTILMLDHAALIGHEQGLDTKGSMDRYSKYCIVLRNMFNATIINIQQFSTDLMSWQRTLKKNEQAIMPQRLDFGDSKAPYRDADVVIGYVMPAAFDYEKFLGYQILGDLGVDCLGRNFIAQCIMKNRYGPSGKIIPLWLNGISGMVYDLPLTPHNAMVMEEWYSETSKYDRLCKVFSPKDVYP